MADLTLERNYDTLEAMDPQSHITITRNSAEDMQQRQVIATLDGERFATLMYGESATRAITPGRHSLRVDNTWNKKKIEFDLALGEHAKFRTINRAGRFTFFLAALGVGPMYVSIDREP